VQTLLVFWVNETSVDVQVVPIDEAPITTSTESTTTTTQSGVIEGIDIYEGCDETKTCFGIGSVGYSSCVSQRNCEVIGAVIYDSSDDTFEFEMRSAVGAGYVAMGLSSDDRMGGDSVVECVNNNGVIEAYASFTYTYGVFRTGIVSCNFSRLMRIPS